MLAHGCDVRWFLSKPFWQFLNGGIFGYVDIIRQTLILKEQENAVVSCMDLKNVIILKRSNMYINLE